MIIFQNILFQTFIRTNMQPEPWRGCPTATGTRRPGWCWPGWVMLATSNSWYWSAMMEASWPVVLVWRSRQVLDNKSNSAGETVLPEQNLEQILTISWKYLIKTPSWTILTQNLVRKYVYCEGAKWAFNKKGIWKETNKFGEYFPARIRTLGNIKLNRKEMIC